MEASRPFAWCGATPRTKPRYAGPGVNDGANHCYLNMRATWFYDAIKTLARRDVCLLLLCSFLILPGSSNGMLRDVRINDSESRALPKIYLYPACDALKLANLPLST